MNTIKKNQPQKRNRIIGYTILLCVFLPFICQSQNLLRSPQKIVVDSKHNRLLVSNFATGDIIQIDKYNNQSYFVRNAGFVDGMEISGNVVYGTGMTTSLKGYDLETRALVMDLTISDVEHLSSIAADSSGNLYITDSFGSKIVKVNTDQQSWSVFKNGLDKPNGIIFEQDKNRLVFICDKPNPPIQAIGLSNDSLTTLATTRLAGGDGIARDNNNNYYITGYYLNGVYKFNSHFDQPGQKINSGNNIVYPTYDWRNNSLHVTKYELNSIESISLGTSGIDKKIVTNEFNSSPTFPNPFSISTTMKYELYKIGHVDVRVYDITGSLVNSLVNKDLRPGSYEISWFGNNIQNQRVAEGIYFLRLSINNFTETKRILLLK
jgi:hypothetical protein